MLRSPRLRRFLASLAVLAVVVALCAGALVLRRDRAGAPAQSAVSGQPLLAFAEFGTAADRVYTAPANDPSQRTLVATVPHAEGWGLNPGTAPAGDLFAYTVLPPEAAPRRDAPADLWVTNLVTHQQTRLARDADLLVQPVLRSDGSQLVYRRTVNDLQALVLVDLASQSRSVIYSEQTTFGVYPIAFTNDGDIVFSRLSTDGTDVYRVHAGDAARELFHASDSVARDWSLSPDGQTLSYLAPEASAERVVERVHVVSLSGRSPRELVTPVAGTGAGEEYGPVWTPDASALTVGREASATVGRAAAVIGLAGGTHALPAPAHGFDVPLAWSADGDYLAVRSFDGSDSTDPGNASLVVVVPAQGRRIPVAGNAELIFIGWIGRA